MKKTFLLIALLLIGSVSLPAAKQQGFKSAPILIYETVGVLDTLTVYNPSRKQCDRDPLVTASNHTIDTAALRKGDLRWMALSRDLLKRWNGAIAYGDTLIIASADPRINGKWIVRDTMNKRYSNRGDLLYHQDVRNLGRWTGVRLAKRKIYSVGDKPIGSIG